MGNKKIKGGLLIRACERIGVLERKIERLEDFKRDYDNLIVSTDKPEFLVELEGQIKEINANNERLDCELGETKEHLRELTKEIEAIKRRVYSEELKEEKTKTKAILKAHGFKEVELAGVSNNFITKIEHSIFREPIEKANPQELSEIEKLEIEIGQINYNIQIHESEILRIKSKENEWQPSAKDRYRDALNKKISIDFVAELKSRKAKLLEDYFNLTKQSKNV